MKIKKIISLLLAVILTFGIATYSFAVQENDDSGLSLLYTFIGSMSAALTFPEPLWMRHATL